MFRIIPLLAIGCLLAGCERKSARPADLPQLAKTFKDKAGTYRVREGESLWKALPTCPETSRQKISDFSTIVTHDCARPSYKLTREETFRALGQPDGINGDQVWWELG